MSDHHDLVDTQEMYLKAITELHEARLPALRARLAERFEQSSPTVSETVNRMSKAGLLVLGNDRVLHFTAEGEQQALSVMRKHRVIEQFLHQVVKLDWSKIHAEACRWEHVASDEAVELMDGLLEHPEVDPFGNKVPQLNGSQVHSVDQPADDSIVDRDHGILSRIGEIAQIDQEFLADCLAQGITLGTDVTVEQVPDGYVLIHGEAEVFVPEGYARGVFLS
ncbi:MULTISPECIES: metal-dependent transcriptional regulator [Auritidibacter]|uniref:metal-dependent transcriptional regulator n=1 Tax=Auritidibacter TaxID=1160973 RepID=UPI000D72DF48|nr:MULTISPECIES: metal-dependent transcriptional regulator [Auritidibacter]AXR74303.1 metal-dependent transcriptional regulator [Auritidibacter sp. NML130574]NIH72123.1 DtxR family Mn-dependent transcriptional regulator [Auritidibacter ignavus]PXA79703.1 hypothetical protein DCC25_07860 [Auritidibacter sp. NML120636]RMX23873.1 metal-dependent transcriptional regulator [Auritidibacter ignavus]WGH80784.1 metal-dependent transcriptional regulator [Auritidibacter ignavus]